MELKHVRFIKQWNKNIPGDFSTFDEKTANSMVRDGYVVIVSDKETDIFGEMEDKKPVTRTTKAKTE